MDKEVFISVWEGSEELQQKIIDLITQAGTGAVIIPGVLKRTS